VAGQHTIPSAISRRESCDGASLCCPARWILKQKTQVQSSLVCGSGAVLTIPRGPQDGPCRKHVSSDLLSPQSQVLSDL